MPVNYRIISGDSHVDMTWLPGDLWMREAPPHLSAIAPRVIETNSGLRWWAEGKELGVVGGLAFGFTKPVKERSRRVTAMTEAGFYEQGRHPTDPDLRLVDMQRDGVDAEVLYGLSATNAQFEDKELLRFMYGVYYKWAAEFCAAHPGRWAALAPIVNHDATAAAEDLRRAAALGLKGADLSISGSARPLFHRAWDSVWEAAEECEIPVSFHSLGLKPRPLDGPDSDEYKAPHENLRSSMFQLGGIESLGGILLSGACERYPGLKFVLGESGISWIPFVIERLDFALNEKRGDFALNLSKKPSEIWRSHGYSTFQDEETVASVVDLVGEDNIMWGSDYPHPDSVWPDSLAAIQRSLLGLREEQTEKIIRNTAGRLYGFLTD